MACCIRCSRGGLIAGLFSAAWTEKERACDQAVHWLPITFSPPQEHLEACTFYPHGHVELRQSACFWGTCIDETNVAQVILPPFRGTFTTPVDSGVAGAGATTEQTDPEPLFDSVNNPSPVLQVLQRTFAMYGNVDIVFGPFLESLSTTPPRTRQKSGYSSCLRVPHADWCFLGDLMLCPNHGVQALRWSGPGLGRFGRGHPEHAAHHHGADGLQHRGATTSTSVSHALHRPSSTPPLARRGTCSTWCPWSLDADRWLLWVVAMGGCYGWLLWVDAMGGCCLVPVRIGC